MSQQSSPQSYSVDIEQTIIGPDGIVRCLHKVPAVCRTSAKQTSLGRKFWVCFLHSEDPDHCKFFKWDDHLFPEKYANLPTPSLTQPSASSSQTQSQVQHAQSSPESRSTHSQPPASSPAPNVSSNKRPLSPSSPSVSYPRKRTSPPPSQQTQSQVPSQGLTPKQKRLIAIEAALEQQKRDGPSSFPSATSALSAQPSAMTVTLPTRRISSSTFTVSNPSISESLAAAARDARTTADGDDDGVNEAFNADQVRAAQRAYRATLQANPTPPASSEETDFWMSTSPAQSLNGRGPSASPDKGKGRANPVSEIGNGMIAATAATHLHAHHPRLGSHSVWRNGNRPVERSSIPTPSSSQVTTTSAQTDAQSSYSVMTADSIERMVSSLADVPGHVRALEHENYVLMLSNEDKDRRIAELELQLAAAKDEKLQLEQAIGHLVNSRLGEH